MINPHQRQSVELKNCASFIKEVRTWALEQSLLPPVLSDANGDIHKPSGWRQQHDNLSNPMRLLDGQLVLSPSRSF